MKYTFLTVLALLVAINTKSQNAVSYPKGIEHVVVIGVDGMSSHGLQQANTPVIDKLIANGTVKWNVRTVLPSSSSPNWASMIMGAGIEAHGVLDNDWEQKDASLPPVVSGNSGLFPTIFSVVRRSRPAAEIGAVYQWEGFGRLFEKEAVSFDKTYGTEDSTVIQFNKYLLDKHPVFAFLHLDDVDGAGHGAGHGTPEYFSAIAKVDSLVGTVLNAVRKAGIEKNTLIIITADHGGIGYGHGGASSEEAQIAMVFYGAGVKKGYQVKQQVYTYDLAATIAFALKIVPPYAWTGRPVKSAFTGFTEPANLWMGKEVLAAPVIYPDKYLYAKAGGLFIDKPAKAEIKPAAPNSETRYTTDGSQPTIKSALYKEPLMLENTAVVKAMSFNKNGAESPVTTAYFRVVKSNNGNGLNTSFYVADNWEHLPEFNDLKPVKTWTNYEFTLNRDQIAELLGKDKTTFAVSMKGYININTPGEYTFFTQSDDGSQLYIDGKKIVDNNDSHGVIERSGSVQLEKGKHAINVTYFNQGGGAWLEVLYKGPGIAKQIVPASTLFLNK